MCLNQTDINYLNEIYARAYKKHFAFSTAVGFAPISYTEAVEAARDELEDFYALRRGEINAKAADRITQITADYETRVIAINNEAAARGLLGSTVVLYQLGQALSDKQAKIDRAEYDRDTALSKFETVTDAKVRTAARKMMNDNAAAMRLRITADKHTLDMLYRQTSIGGFSTIEKQKAMDEEVYGEYLAWLLVKDPQDAFAYVDDDPLFFFNLSTVYYNKLKTEMQTRT